MEFRHVLVVDIYDGVLLLSNYYGCFVFLGFITLLTNGFNIKQCNTNYTGDIYLYIGYDM